MSADVDFSEVTKLAADLGKAAAVIEPLTETKALSEAGRQLHAAASAAAPRDTGELAGSIYLRGGKGWRIVGSDVKQGFFQEFGTSRHPPQPWLYPAGDSAGEDLTKRLEQIADPLP